MTITAGEIQGAPLSLEVRGLATKVNAGTATAAEIQTTNISLAEKRTLESLRANTATRESIMEAPVDPALKKLALGIAGVAMTVYVALTGVRATGSVGTVV